jgi:uncharacterized protein (DUF362 family)
MCRRSGKRNGNSMTRRQWLAASGAGLAAVANAGRELRASAALPTDPVSVGKYPGYAKAVVDQLARQFDQIGGLGSLMRGKTVTVKLNLTGSGRFPGFTEGQTYWVHPDMVGACCHLFGKAGAKRIRLVEGTYEGESLDDKMLDAGWDMQAIRNSAPVVEFVQTSTRGSAKGYTRMKVPHPYIFPAFDLNWAYDETDVFVSLAKLKEHEECGLTLSIKNMFGVTPISIYGDDAGVDEPNENPRKAREQIMHYGNREPSKSAPAELDPKSLRYEGYRVPRICVDVTMARPIHLAILDGIETCTTGEGPWVTGAKHVQPGVVVVGRNPVTTDTVAAAVMGFDPRAGRGQSAFKVAKTHPETADDPKWADNIMLLAEAKGLGSAHLSRIEVRGVPIDKAKFDFAALRKPPARG